MHKKEGLIFFFLFVQLDSTRTALFEWILLSDQLNLKVSGGKSQERKAAIIARNATIVFIHILVQK